MKQKGFNLIELLAVNSNNNFKWTRVYASDIDKQCADFVMTSGSNLIENCINFTIKSNNTFVITYAGYNGDGITDVVGYK